MINLETMNKITDLTMLEKLPKAYKLKNPIKIMYVGDNEIRLIEDKPKIEVDFIDLIRNKGGKWLARVRNWIQCKCRNGESVTWGSQDYLEIGPLTVMDIEYLAAEIAAAAINEYCNKQEI